MKSSKGLGPIAILGACALILFFWYIYVAFFVRLEFPTSRFFKEIPIIGEYVKIETYVRSFGNAVQLSLIQGCYERKDQSSILWYDYGIKVNSDQIFNGSIAPRIVELINGYLNEYREFASEHGEEIYITGETSDHLTKAYINLTNEKIKVISEDELYFKGRVENSKFDRVYKPFAALPSKLKRVWDSIINLLENDEVGDEVENLNIEEDECNVSFVTSKINEILEKVKSDFNTTHSSEKVQMLELTLDNVEVQKIYGPEGFKCCQINVTFKGDVEDLNYEYPVYDGIIKEGNLGLIFKARSGNALVCVYEPFCFDEDKGDGITPYYTYGKIKYDGKEEYDECINETTLLERTCVDSSPSSELYNCPFGCEGGKCKYECEKNEDCDDGNPCTKDECVDGFCSITPLPAGSVCGINSTDCQSSCENGVEKSPVNEVETCSRVCDGNGNCLPCVPQCSYTLKTCRYGCKDSTRCWHGLWCPAKRCSSTDSSGICQGTSECTTEAKCIAEYESRPTCSYYDAAYRWCLGNSKGCASPCLVCCWNSEEICIADCSFNETCTYS